MSNAKNSSSPPAASTLIDVMLNYVQHNPDNAALHVWNSSTRDYTTVPYARLAQHAFGFGQLLSNQGLQPQTVCLIACHSPYSTLIALYGAISAGFIPMILPMPKALGSHEALSQRIEHWGLRFDLPTTLILEQDSQEKFHDTIPAEVNIIRIPDSAESNDWSPQSTPANNFQCRSEDIAFFQTTSSSTGDHKAVAISHSNILCNVRGIRSAVGMDDSERMISWLPLFHDMGLVGTVLFSFCNAYPLYLMTPIQFVKRPALWLKGMTDYRCTIATAPNFGYDYCSRLVSDNDIAKLDLSHVKHLFIGAEPIRVPTIQLFVDRFRSAGISEKTIRPAYGLAESTIITSISRPEDPAGFDCLDADNIGIGQQVKLLSQIAFDPAALRNYTPSRHIAACVAGKAIDGMTIDIVDEEGKSVEGEGYAGEIVLSGDSVAAGYVGEGKNLLVPFAKGRMHSGDLGVIRNGELYIIERIKNIIIRNGENYLVSAIEQQIASLLGTSHEQVAVFETDIHDPSSDILVLVERQAALDEEAVRLLLCRLPQESYPINRLLLSKAREIPRTTSGKKRHFYCRKLYQSGDLNYHQSIEVTAELVAASSDTNAADNPT